MRVKVRNQGSDALRAVGLSVEKMRVLLASNGFETTTKSLSGWRDGSNKPRSEARQAMLKVWSVPLDTWDKPVGEGAAEPRPLPVKASTPIPDAPPPPLDPEGGFENAEELAKDYLDRCRSWRTSTEGAEYTDAQRRHYAGLERQAIQLYAKVSGQAEATENQLVRSPQWARLKAEILRVLEQHPKAAKAVLLALQDYGRAASAA
jgi:hypothetical protein